MNHKGADRVYSKDLCPDEDQQRPQFSSRTLKNFEDIWKNANTQSMCNSPWTKIQESSQEFQGMHSMYLTEEHLEGDHATLNKPSTVTICQLFDQSQTWRTIGSCSGGFRFWEPISSQTWKAWSCWAKNMAGLCCVGWSLDNNSGSWDRQQSRAKSHASHIGCWKLCNSNCLIKINNVNIQESEDTSINSTWYVAGNLGEDVGVQSNALITLSASMKFRNKLATRRSCRKSFWNKSENTHSP